MNNAIKWEEEMEREAGKDAFRVQETKTTSDSQAIKTIRETLQYIYNNVNLRPHEVIMVAEARKAAANL